MSITVALVLNVSIARSSVSYHIKNLECVHEMLAQQEVDQTRSLK